MTREQDIPQELLNSFEEIKQKKGILSEVMLSDITINDVTYSQFLRVRDTQVSLSIGYIKLNPLRCKVNKETGEESPILGELPDWTIREDSLSSWVDPETGQRMLFPTRYRDEEGNIIPQNVDGVMMDEVMETRQVKTTQYLEYLIDSGISFKDIMQMFTIQYVHDATAAGFDFQKI